jgi:hypothetical protein
MHGLAFLLFVLVIGTHYTYDLIAAYYTDPAYAAKALFYILRGFEGAILYLVVWSLSLIVWARTNMRSTGAFCVPVSGACAWGALEEFQTAACRISIGVEVHPITYPFKGLCDQVTGVPVYMVTLLVVVLVFVWQYTRD